VAEVGLIDGKKGFRLLMLKTVPRVKGAAKIQRALHLLLKLFGVMVGGGRLQQPGGAGVIVAFKQAKTLRKGPAHVNVIAAYAADILGAVSHLAKIVAATGD